MLRRLGPRRSCASVVVARLVALVLTALAAPLGASSAQLPARLRFRPVGGRRLITGRARPASELATPRGRLWLWLALAGLVGVLAPPAQADRIYASAAPDDGHALVLQLFSHERALDRLAYHIELRCMSGQRQVEHGAMIPVTERVRRDGRLDATTRLIRPVTQGPAGEDLTYADVRVRVHGRLRRTRGSGTMNATMDVVDTATHRVNDRCTGSARWHARRDPGALYGGWTSQEEPVILTVEGSPRPTSTDEFFMGWDAACQSGGTFSIVDRLVDSIAISRKGVFSVPGVSVIRPQPGGVQRRFDYAVLRGRVRRNGTAAGRLEVTTTADAITCATGPIDWQASTG
jgi:hypothetical protein